MLRVNEQGDTVCRRAASECGPVVFRGLLRAEGLQELEVSLSDLTVFRPIRKLNALGLRKALAELDSLGPFVGLLNHVEARGRQGVPDRPQLDLDEEETEIVVGVLVEPFDGLAVLIAGVGNDPHNHFGAFSGSVGDHLSQMIVFVSSSWFSMITLRPVPASWA